MMITGKVFVVRSFVASLLLTSVGFSVLDFKWPSCSCVPSK